MNMKHSLRWKDKNNSTASYSSSTVAFMKSFYDGYWDRLMQLINYETYRDPYLGLRIAEVEFIKPYLRCIDYSVIALAVMRLLIKYAYSNVFEYGKFTIGYVMKITPTSEVSFIVGKAISLNAVPNIDLYNQILEIVKKKAEDYEKEVLSGIFLRIYMVGMQEKELVLCSDEEIYSKILQLIFSGGGGEPQEVKAMSISRKRRYPNHIPALKPTSKERRPFIVADTETVLVKFMCLTQRVS